MTEPLEIRISSNAAELLGRFDRLPKRIQGGIARGLRRGLLLAESAFLRRHQATTGGSVKLSGARSGLGSRLTSLVARGSDMSLEGAIGFRRTRGFPYELSQEFGAKAKSGKAMAIPLTPEARIVGSPRNFATPLRIQKINGKVFLVMDRPKASFVIEYILKKSIPPRLNFRDTIIRQVPSISDEITKGATEGSSNGS